MRKMLQKIYDTIPVSWKNFKAYMETITKLLNIVKITSSQLNKEIQENKEAIKAITKVLNGMTIASGQQATMLANVVNQVSGIQMKKAEEQVAEDKKVDDPAFG